MSGCTSPARRHAAFWKLGKSVDRHATCLDRRRPLFDFAGHEVLEIDWGSAIGRYQIGADGLHSRPQCRGLHRFNRRLTKAVDDRFWRIVREEQRDPVIGLKVRKALLLRGRYVGQNRRALPRQDGDRLDVACLDRRQLRGDGIAEIVDAARP